MYVLSLVQEQRELLVTNIPNTNDAKLCNRIFYGQYGILSLYYFPSLLLSIGYALFSDDGIKFKTRSKTEKFKIILVNLSIPFDAVQTNFILLGGYKMQREERYFEGLHFVFLTRAIFQLIVYFVFLPICLIAYTGTCATDAGPMPLTLALILVYSIKTV